MQHLTWSEAVQSLRNDPEQQDLVRACYFDDPLDQAAERFRTSLEWQWVRRYLPCPPGHALDLGAGRGISSYALARDGWQVTALEPDPSPLVGAEAIRSLAQQTALAIHVVGEYSEDLPFPTASFDLVNCRQALHHARDLARTCQEIARVLKPGGILMATREHVISQPGDLQRFLDQHPLHHLYGGEHAYVLMEYRSALARAGLKLKHLLRPFDSPINYFPLSTEQVNHLCIDQLSRLPGGGLLGQLVSAPIIGRPMMSLCRLAASHLSTSPGRLYSFVAVKAAAP